MNTLEYQCSVKTNELLITYSPKLLLTSGPCTVSPRVLRAFEEPLAYYNDKRSVKVKKPLLQVTLFHALSVVNK